MPDLVKATLEQIQAHVIPEVSLEDSAIAPAYGGLSLLNLPGSLARWLGAPPLPHPAIDLPMLDSLAENVDQVVMVLVDALGLDQFLDWSQGPASQFQIHIQRGLLAPLTSVVPSTTSTALTTLWTGRSPIEHGILGYEREILFIRS